MDEKIPENTECIASLNSYSQVLTEPVFLPVFARNFKETVAYYYQGNSSEPTKHSPGLDWNWLRLSASA